MKKLLLIAILMLALVFTVVACTNEPTTTETTAGETTAAAPADTTAEPADTTAEPAPADTTAEPAPADTTAEPVTTEEPVVTTAEPETTAEPLPYVEKEAAGMVAHSFDTFFANGEMYFEQDGGAGDKLTAQDNKISFKTGDACQSIALRGWIGFGQAIESFGYYVDGYKFVWGEFTQDTEAGVLAAGGENASRFCITVPLTKLAVGEHMVGFAVKLADGTVVRLRAELTVTIEKTLWDANKDVVTHQSFDELDLQLNGEKTGAAFDPFNGGAASWDKTISLYDLSADTLRYWGWVGVKGELGQFGYQINGGTAIYDDAWTHATEQPVIDAAAPTGADTASRMQIMISLQGLTGTNTITVLYKNAEGVAVILNEFTVVLPGKLPVEVPNHEDVRVELATYYDGASLMSFTYLGQKVSLGENFLKSITLRSIATSGSNPAWKLKLWVWNTDYDTTIASAPLFVATGKDHGDWADLTIEIPAALGITGDIYYEIEVLSGQMLIHQAEAKLEGLETYLNGVPNGTSYESHMFVGVAQDHLNKEEGGEIADGDTEENGYLGTKVANPGKTSAEIVIDGILDDAYKASATFLTIPHRMGTDAGNSAVAWVMYDNDNIYVLVEVTDSTLDASAAQVWLKDSVSVVVDFNYAREKGVEYGSNGMGYATIAIDGATAFYHETEAGVPHAVVVDEENGKYYVEVAMPITDSFNGEKVGFEITICDAADGSQVGGLSWNISGVLEAWHYSHVCGTLNLPGIEE